MDTIQPQRLGFAIMSVRNLRIRGLRFFLASSVLILGLTGLFKLASVLSGSPELQTRDPLLSTPLWLPVTGAALVELGLAAFCVFSEQPRRCLWFICWMACTFAIYRYGVWAADPTRPCPCLGKAPELVGASQFQMDLLAKLLLGYLFGGGALFLILGSNPPKRLVATKHE